MRKILLYISATFLSIIMLIGVAVFLMISFLDLNNWREEITASLSESLGQEVKIYGVFDVQLSFSPSAEITDIEIANADWSDNKPAVRIQNLYAKISLWSLFGRPVIEELILHNAVVRLEKKDNKSNLGGGKTDNDHHEGGGNFLDDLPIIQKADIKNVMVFSTDHDSKTSFELPINSISVKGSRKQTDINVNIGNIKSNKKTLGGLTLNAQANKDSFTANLRQGKAINGKVEYHSDSKLSADIRLNRFSMEVLDILTGGTYGLGGNLNGRITLNATGDNKDDLMKSLNGNIDLESDKVTIRKGIPALSALNITDLSASTSGCFIMEAPIDRGVVAIKGASALNIGDIKTQGRVNLVNEKLDLTNDVKIALPILTANGEVKITGTLDKPDIDIGDFGDLKIDGAGILQNLADKPEDAVEQIGGFLGSILGGDTESQQAQQRTTNLQACKKLLQS